MSLPTEERPHQYPKWSRRFLTLARTIASWSKDPSTKVGAVAVGDGRQILCEGYNGLPRGVGDNSDRMERPAKYLWTVHAEANLVAHAAAHGVSLRGATVYVTHNPCAQCAALLIQAGIKRVIVDRAGEGKTKMGDETFVVAGRMFREANVDTMFVNVDGDNDAAHS